MIFPRVGTSGTKVAPSTEKRVKANWLLRSLILLSLGIHTLVFLHLSGLYRSRALTAIELTLADLSKATPRDIPRPRPRMQPPPEALRKEIPRVAPRPIPSFEPLKLQTPEKDLPDTIVEKLSMPNQPAASPVGIADWVPPRVEQTRGDFATAQSYLELVRLKIERYKEYPEKAKARQTQGRVTVHFVITPEGELKTARIAKSSRHAILDDAAVKAVKNAAPFPKPPARFFKGEIPMTITVVFELM